VTEEERLTRLENRISDHDSRIRASETSLAILGVQLGEIKEVVNGIRMAVNRVAWIVVAGILAAFVTWVVNGGLVNVPV
jgi:hypothetical protein